MLIVYVLPVFILLLKPSIVWFCGVHTDLWSVQHKSICSNYENSKIRYNKQTQPPFVSFSDSRSQHVKKSHGGTYWVRLKSVSFRREIRKFPFRNNSHWNNRWVYLLSIVLRNMKLYFLHVPGTTYANFQPFFVRAQILKNT